MAFFAWLTATPAVRDIVKKARDPKAAANVSAK